MSTSARTRTSRGLRIGLVAALACGLTATLTTLPAQAGAQRVGAQARSDVTFVHANIYTGLSVTRFQSDVREVLAQSPDFVTYNEISFRQDAVMAPAGYDIHRKPKNRYTAATAVAWREDRWTAVDEGTFRISNYRKIPRGKKTRLGLRFVNWVTLRSPEGRQLSVVAAHVAPLTRGMPDLVESSVRRLGKLVDRIAPAGPVLVGGDFNVHYTSQRYPRRLFKAAQLVPTYDALGSHFPTGDHQGATIDFVFNRGAGKLAAAQHRSVELNSDHDAVVAGLDWQVDTPADTRRLVSNPKGTSDARRRALTALVEVVRTTPAGGELDVVTTRLAGRALFRRLRGAVARGVDVRLTTRSSTTTAKERRLKKIFRRSGDTRSRLRRCRSGCLASWKHSDLPRGFVLVRDAGGEPTTRVDVNRTFNKTLLQRRTRLVLRTGEVELQEGERLLASLR